MADKMMDDQIKENVSLLKSKGYLDNGTGTTSAVYEHELRNQVHGVLLAKQFNDKGQPAQVGDWEIFELPVVAQMSGQQIQFPFFFKLELDTRKLSINSMSVRLADGQTAHVPLESPSVLPTIDAAVVYAVGKKLHVPNNLNHRLVQPQKNKKGPRNKFY